MLKAYLKRKDHRQMTRADESDQPSEPVDVTELEDLLTSAVFERLAYLDAGDAWLLLGAGSVLLGPPLQVAPPSQSPSWRFWPRLPVGALGQNARYVEPDVVVEWGPVLLTIEAKHAGDQVGAQWVEQIRAVLEAYPGKQIVFIAVGGLDPRDADRVLAHVQEALGPEAPSILALSWGELARSVDARARQGGASGPAACYADIAAALHAWGYRPTTWFATLPSAAKGLAISSSPTDIPPLRTP